jgi:preprotein translocase subunit SecA
VLAWGQGELSKREQSNGQDEAEAMKVGKQVLNQVHRQLLLRAITEQWVEYLTRVEALRVSIGLEAYAQRDPLVQYKAQASQMFQGLLADIRSLVISRIFASRPRRIQLTLTDSGESPAAPQAPAKKKAQITGKKKKKRRRRRR